MLMLINMPFIVNLTKVNYREVFYVTLKLERLVYDC